MGKCSLKMLQTLSVFTYISELYIEDITRQREDMNFIFGWYKQYFTKERSE